MQANQSASLYLDLQSTYDSVNSHPLGHLSDINTTRRFCLYYSFLLTTTILEIVSSCCDVTAHFQLADLIFLLKPIQVFRIDNRIKHVLWPTSMLIHLN